MIKVKNHFGSGKVQPAAEEPVPEGWGEKGNVDSTEGFEAAAAAAEHVEEGAAAGMEDAEEAVEDAMQDGVEATNEGEYYEEGQAAVGEGYEGEEGEGYEEGAAEYEEGAEQWAEDGGEGYEEGVAEEVDPDAEDDGQRELDVQPPKGVQLQDHGDEAGASPPKVEDTMQETGEEGEWYEPGDDNSPQFTGDVPKQMGSFTKKGSKTDPLRQAIEEAEDGDERGNEPVSMKEEPYIPLSLARKKIMEILADMIRMRAEHLKMVTEMEGIKTELKASAQAQVDAYLEEVRKDQEETDAQHRAQLEFLEKKMQNQKDAAEKLVKELEDENHELTGKGPVREKDTSQDDRIKELLEEIRKLKLTHEEEKNDLIASRESAVEQARAEEEARAEAEKKIQETTARGNQDDEDRKKREADDADRAKKDAASAEEAAKKDADHKREIEDKDRQITTLETKLGEQEAKATEELKAMEVRVKESVEKEVVERVERERAEKVAEEERKKKEADDLKDDAADPDLMKADEHKRQLQEKDLTIALKDKSITKLEKKLADGKEEVETAQKELAEAQAKAEEAEKELEEARTEQKKFQEQWRGEQQLRKRYFNLAQDLKGKIRAVGRCRPVNDQELATGGGGEEAVEFLDEYSVRSSAKNREFTLDRVFTPEHDQDDLWDECRSYCQSVVDGFNCCIFAHGQTGAGKTYTMSGTEDLPGLTPRAVVEIFATLQKMHTVTYKVSTYMIELYNDQLYDLYLPDKARKSPPHLEIKKDGRGMIFIDRSVILPANDAVELSGHYDMGCKARRSKGTGANAASSRSHLMFTILVETKNKQTGQSTFGKLTLVDLAGSEKVTDADPETLAETRSINKSLTALQDVVSVLASPGEGETPSYKNNKLTLLLSDSLGGNCKTLMVVCFSPAQCNHDETLMALGYASRVKAIVNEAKRNDESASITRLRDIIKRLKAGEAIDDAEINEVTDAAQASLDRKPSIAPPAT